MSKTRKLLLTTGSVVLTLFILFGCSLLFRDGSEQSGWHIKLNINPQTAAKAINVNEYDVTGLTVEVYDPFGVLIEEIAWQKVEGQQSYLIPVKDQGEHEIVVTHISDENGVTVEAEESALFNIQAMVITVIEIIPGCIGVIDISPGGEETVKEDGTLTVSFMDVGAPDGTSVLIGVYPAGVDPTIDPFLMIQAMGHIELIGGAGSSTVKEPDSDITWIGTGGSSYDVYVWVDINDNLDQCIYPESGIDLQLATFPVTVKIDGNISLDFLGSDFVIAP